MSFWGVEVKPGKDHTLADSVHTGPLRLTQATLGPEVGKGEKGGGKTGTVYLQCLVGKNSPVTLCALVPGQSETCHMDLEFDEEFATFSVLGSRSVHLAGYYIRDAREVDMSDSDSGSDSLQGLEDDGLMDTDDDGDTMILPVSGEMSTDSESDDSDYDSETDEEEIMYNQHRGKSSVVIEEIQDDDNPADGEGQRGSNKKQSSGNGDNSQLQLAVKALPAESLESEDEDGFPVSFPESKKSAQSSSKKNRKLNNETSNEDRKRKSHAIIDHPDSSGEVKAENDGVSKKKKRPNAKKAAVDSEEKESKQQNSADDPVSAKQKKKKDKNLSASEAHTDQKINKENHVDNDDKQVIGLLSAKKKNKKKKTQEKKTSEKQASTEPKESESKAEPHQTRTFGNGLIIEEVAMGEPDGKIASNGKKVSVKYIGKLKNGKFFDSTAGGRPFEFRLGIGQVIKGWDVGINGMRVGDKRRLTIPPSMGYGNQKTGTIPPNSTLVFDVELVNVK